MDYPSNSKYKTDKEPEQKMPEKRATKLKLQGSVKKKSNFFSSVFDFFFQESPDDIRNSLAKNVIRPAIARLITDTVKNGVDMMFYGSEQPKSNNGYSSYVSYGSYSGGSNMKSSQSISRKSFDDILFQNRGDAEDVLATMGDILDRYKLVRVADLCELAGVESPYTANDYGWTDIRGARIDRVRDGFVLKMPRAMPID